jgi:hypothetical protein
MSTDSSTTTLPILLTRRESQSWLEDHKLPLDFPARVDAFIRLSVCTNCDDRLDMNEVLRTWDDTPSWCSFCCDENGVPAFTRYAGRERTDADPIVVLTAEDQWLRHDPLTLNDAVIFERTGELPDNFADIIGEASSFSEY